MTRLFPNRTQRFCFVVSVLGLGVAVVSTRHGFGNLGNEPQVLALLCLGVLVGELLPLRIPRRGDDEEVTISTTFSFALLLAGGPALAIAAQVVASALQDVLSRKPPWRIAFNVGQYTISLAAASVVLTSLTSLPHRSGPAFTSLDLPAILLAGLTFWIVNTGIVGVAIALYQDVRIREYFRSDIGFSFITGAVLLCLSPVMLGATEFGVGLFPLLFFPIYAVYRGGRAAATSQHRATHDLLTDLPNRGLFRDLIVDEMRVRGATARFTVLLMDLDRFKWINDTLGHQYGDCLLKAVGPRIATCLRDGDVIARLGGDEFGILLPRLGDVSHARDVAGRLCAALADPFELEQFTVGVDASIGIARFPQDGADVDDLLRRADVAMYQAKADSSGHQVYSADRDDYSPTRLSLVADLRHGIDRGELVLHYQPKLELATGAVTDVEALVRWQHPVLGLLQPYAFIDLAERTGVMRMLTLKVIETALTQTAAWRAAGRGLTVAVNVSVRSLLDPCFPAEIADRLARAGAPADSLAIEITESTMMADPQAALGVLRKLGEMGIQLAIDDFGTGYSSLAYLKQLPACELKIDRQFVMDLLLDRSNEVIVRSTIELGHNLGLRVVAEGVEDTPTLERLERLGCDQAQGFHISRPVLVADLERWLDHRTPTAAAAPVRNLLRVG